MRRLVAQLAACTLLVGCVPTGAAPPAPAAAGPSPAATPGREPAPEPTNAPGSRVTGRFPDDVGAEVSGVAAGRDVEGLWLVDDEPGTDRVHLVRLDGTRLATVVLRGVDVVNAEDLAVGPCAIGAGSCLTVADIGDNVAAREDVVLLSFPESVAAAGGTVEVTPTERRLRLPAPVDAEALAIAPDGTVLLVDKTPDVAGVHLAAPGDTELRRVGGLVLPRPARPLLELLVDRVVTAADIPADGGTVLLRTYDELLELRPGDGQDLTTLADWTRTQLRTPVETQGEAATYLADGSIATVSEGSTAITMTTPTPVG